MYATMKHCIIGLAVLALLVCMASPATAAFTTYDTTYAWNGSDAIGAFGTPNTTTYGQTFIAPANNVLQDFTFYVNASPGTTLQFTPYVYAWTGSLLAANSPQGATGSPLYSGSSIVLNGTGAFQAVTVITGGVSLTPGADYVALFTMSDTADYNATTGRSIWGLASTGHVSGNGGGGFNFYNNGNNFALINNGNWDDRADFGDSAWTAHFSSNAVPEPASLTLLGMGGLGLLGFGWKRRKQTVQA